MTEYINIALFFLGAAMISLVIVLGFAFLCACISKGKATVPLWWVLLLSIGATLIWEATS